MLAGRTPLRRRRPRHDPGDNASDRILPIAAAARRGLVEVPAEVEAIAVRLMRRSPAERYADASAVIAAIDRAPTGEGPRAIAANGSAARSRPEPSIDPAFVGAKPRDRAHAVTLPMAPSSAPRAARRALGTIAGIAVAVLATIGVVALTRGDGSQVPDASAATSATTAAAAPIVMPLPTPVPVVPVPDRNVERRPRRRAKPSKPSMSSPRCRSPRARPPGSTVRAVDNTQRPRATAPAATGVIVTPELDTPKQPEPALAPAPAAPVEAAPAPAPAEAAPAPPRRSKPRLPPARPTIPTRPADLAAARQRVATACARVAARRVSSTRARATFT